MILLVLLLIVAVVVLFAQLSGVKARLARLEADAEATGLIVEHRPGAAESAVPPAQKSIDPGDALVWPGSPGPMRSWSLGPRHSS